MVISRAGLGEGSKQLMLNTHKSKCWFHFGSREDLQVSVLWHWPEPSTLTLAKGSGSRNRSFLARFLAQSTAKKKLTS